MTVRANPEPVTLARDVDAGSRRTKIDKCPHEKVPRTPDRAEEPPGSARRAPYARARVIGASREGMEAIRTVWFVWVWGCVACRTPVSYVHRSTYGTFLRGAVCNNKSGIRHCMPN